MIMILFFRLLLGEIRQEVRKVTALKKKIWSIWNKTTTITKISAVYPDYDLILKMETVIEDKWQYKDKLSWQHM